MCGIICGESTSSRFTDCFISGTVQFIAASQNYTTPISGFGVYCGKATSTNFTNCINDVNVTAKTSAIAGGFVALAINCKYTNCTNNGNISGEKTIGGFAAYDSSTSTVVGCVNNGNILTTAYNAGSSYFTNSKQGFVSGGFFGYKIGGSIKNSFNYGEVKGNYCAGGFVGYYSSESDHVIEYCSNHGSITASDVYAYAGGIIGYFLHSATSGNTFKIQYVSNHGNIKSSTGAYSYYIYTQGAGGICGYFSGLSVTSISNVYNTGSVLAYHANCSCYAGGIIGVVPQSKNGSTDKTSLVLNYAYNIGQIGNASLGTDSSHAILGQCLSSLNSALTKMQNVYALNGCCSNNEVYTGISGGIYTEEQLKSESNFNGFDFMTKWFIDPFNETYSYPQLVDVDVNNITNVTVIDENETVIETIEGNVPSFEKILLQLGDANGNHTIIPFRANYIFSGYNINNVSLQHIKVKYANVLSENEFDLSVISKSIS